MSSRRIKPERRSWGIYVAMGFVCLLPLLGFVCAGAVYIPPPKATAHAPTPRIEDILAYDDEDAFEEERIPPTRDPFWSPLEDWRRKVAQGPTQLQINSMRLAYASPSSDPPDALLIDPRGVPHRIRLGDRLGENQKVLDIQDEAIVLGSGIWGEKESAVVIRMADERSRNTRRGNR